MKTEIKLLILLCGVFLFLSYYQYNLSIKNDMLMNDLIEKDNVIKELNENIIQLQNKILQIVHISNTNVRSIDALREKLKPILDKKELKTFENIKEINISNKEEVLDNLKKRELIYEIQPKDTYYKYSGINFDNNKSTNFAVFNRLWDDNFDDEQPEYSTNSNSSIPSKQTVEKDDSFTRAQK